MLWIWAILLVVLGLGLAVMEIFFPSAGILGFLAAAAIIGGIVVGFQHSAITGLILMIAALFGVPSVLVAAFRYWPRTAMGRKIMLIAPRSEDVLPDDDERQRLRGLVGKLGRAKCKMLPGGSITIEGRSIDAVSEGQPIEAGETVRVVQIRGKRLVVRRADEERPFAPPPTIRCGGRSTRFCPICPTRSPKGKSSRQPTSAPLSRLKDLPPSSSPRAGEGLGVGCAKV